MTTKIKNTTHQIIANTLIVYRRERSSAWQCRFKVDGIWQRASTKQGELECAKKKALELLYEAEARSRAGIPAFR